MPLAMPDIFKSAASASHMAFGPLQNGLSSANVAFRKHRPVALQPMFVTSFTAWHYYIRPALTGVNHPLRPESLAHLTAAELLL
jgi:hypothetical protein